VNFFKPNMKKHWAQKYDEGFSGHEPDSTQIEAALKDALGPGSVLELAAGDGHAASHSGPQKTCRSS